ncbi:MAG: hypothetical protein DLM53_00420 [Candidatus Eremiobacter antarcticus]|nr:MAG: hypothetical protein DLM53_00420 [Candidatus Eremiobacter sp. RRmetagenome_bin22]
MPAPHSTASLSDVTATTTAEDALTIAVCIPSKNRPSDVLRCLASIERQTQLPNEIILVDQSGSAYGLPKVEGLVHIYDPSLSGASAAKNAGARASTSAVILFLDDDVELLPACIETLRECLRHNPDAVGVGCSVINNSTGLGLWKVHAWLFGRGFFNSEARTQGGMTELRRLGSCAAAVRRDVLLREQFDENLVAYSYGEDWELSYRLLRYGRLLLSRESQFVHHASPQNRYAIPQLQRDRWDNFLYFFDKLDASRQPLNRAWRLWWMFGESLMWLRNRMGLPVFGMQARNTPKRSLSLRKQTAVQQRATHTVKVNAGPPQVP